MKLSCQPLPRKVIVMNDGRAADMGLISTFGRLVEAYQVLESGADRSLTDTAGLPHTWFEVLLRVSRADGAMMSMSVLAGQLALTTGGVTRLLDRMITAGYVQRVPCRSDRRVSFAALTPAGTRKLEQAMAIHTAGLRQAFAGFTPAELAQLDRFLDRLRSPATAVSTAAGPSVARRWH